MYYSQDSSGSSGKGKGGSGYRTNYRNNVDDSDSKSNDSSRHNIFSHRRHQHRDLEDVSSKGCSSKGCSQDESSEGGPQLISSGYVAPVMCPENPCTSSPSSQPSSICDDGYGAIVCVPREVVLRKVECEGHLVDVCISSKFVQDALDRGGSCGSCASSTEDDLAKLEPCPKVSKVMSSYRIDEIGCLLCVLYSFYMYMSLIPCFTLMLQFADK